MSQDDKELRDLALDLINEPIYEQLEEIQLQRRELDFAEELLVEQLQHNAPEIEEDVPCDVDAPVQKTKSPSAEKIPKKVLSKEESLSP